MGLLGWEVLVVVAAEADPFFEFDGDEGEQGDGGDFEPGGGGEGCGLEEVVHDGEVGEGELGEDHAEGTEECEAVGEEADGEEGAVE